MEMTIALPIAATPAAKAGTRSSGDKTAGSPFGEILGLTLENVSLPKEKAPASDGSVPQAVLSAMFALLQPTLTNIQSSAQSSTEVMNNTVEPSQVTNGQLTGITASANDDGFTSRVANASLDLTTASMLPFTIAVANDDGFTPRIANASLDLTAASMLPLAEQPLLAVPRAVQARMDNSKQIMPDIAVVQQPPVLINASGIEKKADGIEVYVMNDTISYSKTMDLQAEQDRTALALLPNRLPTASIPKQLQQQETGKQHTGTQLTGIQHTAIVTIDAVSSNEDKSAATNVLQPDSKTPLGVNPKATEEWQFDSSEYHGEHKQLSELPSVRNEAPANTALFQSVLEKQSGAKPFEAVSGQPQQQTALADSYGVASQIVEHAKLISRPQNTEMIIKLKPEHLGELTFKVAVEQGTMTATFHSANPEVRSIIETSLPQLKQELSNQGIKLDNVGVFAGMDQFLSGEHRGGQQYQQSEVPLSRRHNNDFAETVTEALQTEPVKNNGGVDYRV